MNDHLGVTPAQAGPGLMQIASRLLNRPLLLHPTKAEVLLHVLQGRIPLDGAVPAALGPEASRFVGNQRRADGSYRMNRSENGVAIISIVGALVNRGAWIGANSGLVSYEGVAAQVREAAGDPEVHTILLDLDSPGGEATGMFATARLIAEVNASKRVVAFVNDMAASAAYGLASAAGEIVVSPTSIVGSIGVVLTHMDRSAELDLKGVKVTQIFAGNHKVDGNPFGPLSDSVRADLQIEVAQFYDQFVSLVAAGRGDRMTEAAIRGTEARTYLGGEAVKLGLADRSASLDALLADLTKPPPGAANRGNVSMSTTPAIVSAAAETAITPEANAAAIASARVEGATAERTRISAILNHPEAEGRSAQAATLALEPELSAEAAGRVLAASPKVAPATQTIADRAASAGGFGGDAEAGENVAAEAAIDKFWGKALGRK